MEYKSEYKLRQVKNGKIRFSQITALNWNFKLIWRQLSRCNGPTYAWNKSLWLKQSVSGIRGVTRGSQFPGPQITAGGLRITAAGAEKSQHYHKYFLQNSTFASKKHQVRTWGHQTCFLPRAPSKLVTPLNGMRK